MRSLYLKIRSSEFLSYSEILALKVSFMLVTLLLISFVTIPINIFETTATVLQIIVPVSFTVSFVTAVVFLIGSKPRTAMHFSLLPLFIILASFLTLTNPVYIYLFLFIILAVLIYYQEGFSFFVYGTLLTIFGIAYMFFNVDQFNAEVVTSVESFRIIVYQVTFITFYVFFLFYFINSELSNDQYFNDFVESRKYTQAYLNKIVQLRKSLEERNAKEPIYNQPSFQQSLMEMTTFLGELIGHPAKEMQELVEFYLYLHEIDVSSALEKKDLKFKTRNLIQQLNKYLLNENNEFLELSYEMIAGRKEGLSDYDDNYETSIDKLLKFDTDKLIGQAVIYRYLRQEVTQFDKWGQVSESLSHTQIRELFQTKFIDKFMTRRELSVFLDNEEIFKTL